MLRYRRSATPDEQIVNEKIFGYCNHSDWVEFKGKFEQRNLVCTKCGEEYCYSDGLFQEENFLSQREFMLATIRKYSEDEVLASLIIRQVEAGKWRALITQHGNTFVCAFEQGGVKFSSHPCSSRSAAVCEAAARLGESGDFLPSRGLTKRI